jgi:hypothetical protein
MRRASPSSGKADLRARRAVVLVWSNRKASAEHKGVLMTYVPSSVLPPDVAEYLDGDRLATKAGNAMLLITADSDGTPHCALLSPGEVLARDDQHVGLVLHAGTGTADALRQQRPALLVVVVGNRAVRVYLDVIGHRNVDVKGDASSVFHTQVSSITDDVVSYARLVHGITYELTDPKATVEAWRAKLENLRD